MDGSSNEKKKTVECGYFWVATLIDRVSNWYGQTVSFQQPQNLNSDLKK